MLTLPNLISSLRILLIPVFVAMILDHDTSTAGLVLFGTVAATDWVDGVIARRTDRVTELGKILDPTADRLAIAAGIIALAVRHVFPWWAALAILVRDAVVLCTGISALVAREIRLEVRYVGKAATFALMGAVALIAWGNLGLPLRHLFLAVGWTWFAIGIVEYYAATAAYAVDLRRAFAVRA